MSYSHFGRPFFAFLVLWGALRLHCNASGLLCHPWYLIFACFSYLVGPWGSVCWFVGSVWAPLAILVCFCGSVAGSWAPFSGFLDTPRKRVKKEEKKGAEMDVFPMDLKVFQENAKVCSDCAGLSGLRFSTFLFCYFCFLFFASFFSCFFDLPGVPDSKGRRQRRGPLKWV